MREDGLRRFRIAFVEIPRKNGKSTFAAGLMLYLLTADGEPGAEVYSAATKRDQARITHGEAVRMRNASPVLRKRIKKVRDHLGVEATNSKCEPLGADADTMDGLNIHGVIIDELHAHKTRAVVDVLETATGSRRQPLQFEITTAGYDQNSVCYEHYGYSKQVLSGVFEDDTWFAFIAEIDDGDDWSDEATWAKANPNLGVSVKLDDLQRKAEKAKHTPAALNAFLRLHLNKWTQQDERWIPLEKWDACLWDVDPDALSLRDCYGGIDLSSTIDISALALVFADDDGGYQMLVWFWIPEDSMHEREQRDRVPYSVWCDQGWVTATSGNVIDYDYIRNAVSELSKGFDIREIGYDPWNATQFVLKLQEDGLTMIPVRQGFASMTAPSKEFEKLIVSGKLRHNGNPVMRWMVDNVTVASDPAGNIKPVKPDRGKSTKRIDGVVATIIALDRAVRNAEQGGADNGVMIWG